MPPEERPTRKDFLLAMAGAALVAHEAQAQPAARKVLLVVAHPDDEYVFAASTYRLVRELGWTADQVVITNGESGFRYAAPAEAFYGVPLAREADARTHLPAIRREETERAGRILGIRRQLFLEQRDLGFDRDASAADAGNWDRARVLAVLSELLAAERYAAVLTMLPTRETHGHHRAATLLALEAIARLPEAARPLAFGAEAYARGEQPRFTGLTAEPLTATLAAAPAIAFDRTAPLAHNPALNYQMIVNWVIAEHKSQGLFQMEANRHDFENFWQFAHAGTQPASFAKTLLAADGR